MINHTLSIGVSQTFNKILTKEHLKEKDGNFTKILFIK